MKPWLVASPFLLLLFILPFPGTVALRLLCLTFAFLVAALSWRRLDPAAFPLKGVLAFWITIALLSLVYAVDPDYSMGEIKNEIGYSLMALLAFYAFFSDQKRVWLGAWAVVLSVGVIAVWSLWLIAQTGYWHEDAAHGGSGTYATLLLMAIPAFFLLWRWQPGARAMLVLIAALVVLAGAYSRQRVLWPAMGGEVGMLVMLMRHRSGDALPRRRVVALVLGIAAIASALLVATQGARLVAHGGAVELDRDLRLRHWPAVTARILDHPMTGAGFGRNAMKLGYPDLVHAPEFWHAHNLFLNYGLSLGVPGMLALVGLFAGMAWTYWRMFRNPDPSIAAIGIAGLMLLVSVILRNSSNDFFQRDMALLFWSMNGLLLGFGMRLLRKADGAGA